MAYQTTEAVIFLRANHSEIILCCLMHINVETDGDTLLKGT